MGGHDLWWALTDAARRGAAAGRPQVLGGVQGELVLWLFEDHQLGYRLFLLGDTALASLLLWALLGELGWPRSLRTVALVLLGASIQFRSYHDPLLGYYGTTQLTLAAVLGSLIFFARGLRQGAGRRNVIGAVLLFVVACMMNEWAYPLSLVHCGVALSRLRWQDALRRSAPVLGVTVLAVFAGVLARLLAPPSADLGYAVGLRPAAVARAWAVQVVSALPTTNFALSHNRVQYFVLGRRYAREEILGASLRGIAAAAVVSVICLRNHRSWRFGVRFIRALPTGLALLLLPPVLIAFAPKYQEELNAAKGYLPTLVQVFGTAILFAAILAAAVGRASRSSRLRLGLTIALASVVVGSLGFVDGLNNARVVGIEKPVARTQELLFASLDHGLFASMPPRSTVLFSESDFWWPTGALSRHSYAIDWHVAHRTGLRLDARIVASEDTFDCRDEEFPPSDCAVPSARGAWVRVRARKHGGTVTVATFAGGEPHTATAIRLDAFVLSHGSGAAEPRLEGVTFDGSPWNSDALQWSVAGEGRSWMHFRVELRGRPSPVAASVHDPLGAVDFLRLGTPEDNARLVEPAGALP